MGQSWICPACEPTKATVTVACSSAKPCNARRETRRTTFAGTPHHFDDDGELFLCRRLAENEPLGAFVAEWKDPETSICTRSVSPGDSSPEVRGREDPVSLRLVLDQLEREGFRRATPVEKTEILRDRAERKRDVAPPTTSAPVQPFVHPIPDFAYCDVADD